MDEPRKKKSKAINFLCRFELNLRETALNVYEPNVSPTVGQERKAEANY